MTPTERETVALRLAHNTARRMHRPEVHRILLDDLEGAAMLGAAKALAQWDPSRGVAFRSYAIGMIRNQILEEVRGWDYLKRRDRTEARRIREATGEWPAWAEEPLSLDGLRDTRGETWLERIPDPDVDVEGEALLTVEQERKDAEWRRLVERLPRQPRRVILMRYWEEKRPADISRELGNCSNMASEAEQRALPRLREWAEAAGLAP